MYYRGGVFSLMLLVPVVIVVKTQVTHSTSLYQLILFVSIQMEAFTQ